MSGITKKLAVAFVSLPAVASSKMTSSSPEASLSPDVSWRIGGLIDGAASGFAVPGSRSGITVERAEMESRPAS